MKLVIQTTASLPHVPDKILEGAEGDHPAHALARRSERVVQQDVAHARHVDHPVVIEVGREGHSKRQSNETTVSRDEGERSVTCVCCEHSSRGCRSRLTARLLALQRLRPAALASPSPQRCRVPAATNVLTQTLSPCPGTLKMVGK